MTEAVRLETLRSALRGVLQSVGMDGISENALESADAILDSAWNRRTPAVSREELEKRIERYLRNLPPSEPHQLAISVERAASEIASLLLQESKP